MYIQILQFEYRFLISTFVEFSFVTVLKKYLYQVREFIVILYYFSQNLMLLKIVSVYWLLAEVSLIYIYIYFMKNINLYFLKNI